MSYIFLTQVNHNFNFILNLQVTRLRQLDHYDVVNLEHVIQKLPEMKLVITGMIAYLAVDGMWRRG